MSRQIIKKLIISAVFFIICKALFLSYAAASDPQQVTVSNFGLPGIIDLPKARRFPDGELIVTQQLHKSLARSGIAFQAIPRVGVAFNYTGHGINGGEAYGRINHDRSFDAHISVLDEGSYFPAISIGLRDFIGTGWYSSEYIVGTKSIGNIDLTVGLGFGRLAKRNSFPNPLSALSSRFDKRGASSLGEGGLLRSFNWFQGDAAAFYGVQYHLKDNITISSEYTPDTMSVESSYLDVKSPWNFGLSYQLNNYVKLSTQYLHGSQVSVTAHVAVNPGQPPLLGGKELAPVPMRARGVDALAVNVSDEEIIRKVLTVDGFEILNLEFSNDTVSIIVKSTKFRSTAQAVGRVSSTLQRFAADDIKFANISFYSKDLRAATYRVDLERVGEEQFEPVEQNSDNSSITAIDSDAFPIIENKKSFIWGIGPYIEHRLFNPDLPLSMETGIEVEAGYQITTGLKISGSVRKSVLTNFTENKRLDSGSLLPRVHSNWPLYDLAGQKGHLYSLAFSYFKIWAWDLRPSSR